MGRYSGRGDEALGSAHDARSRGSAHAAICIHLCEETAMTLGTILLIVLILLLIGAIPAWPHSRSWGYGPSGGLGLVVVILLVLLLLGYV
jgi:hypothetical protein